MRLKFTALGLLLITMRSYTMQESDFKQLPKDSCLEAQFQHVPKDQAGEELRKLDFGYGFEPKRFQRDPWVHEKALCLASTIAVVGTSFVAWVLSE